MKKSRKTLFVLSIIMLGCGFVFLVSGTIINILGYEQVSSLIIACGSLFEIAALILVVINFIKNGFPGINNYSEAKIYVKVNQDKIVDEKAHVESQEEKLYKQYENLYNEGLISKEDLDKKKKELLN